MFLIERQRSSVPHVLFLVLTHSSISAAFLRYQTHVTPPHRSLYCLPLSTSQSLYSFTPRLFIYQALNESSYRAVPDWSGGWWGGVCWKDERGRGDLWSLRVIESSALVRLNLAEGLTYPSAHACMILHALPRWELMHICRHKIGNLTVGRWRDGTLVEWLQKFK